MKIMLLLILFSLALAAGFLLVYLWAARNGQFDDDYTPSVRILFDEPLSSASEEIVESVSTPVESIQSK
jgi:cbb3-type cytochrome oxidase maturation protein